MIGKMMMIIMIMSTDDDDDENDDDGDYDYDDYDDDYDNDDGNYDYDDDDALEPITLNLKPWHIFSRFVIAQTNDKLLNEHFSLDFVCLDLFISANLDGECEIRNKITNALIGFLTHLPKPIPTQKDVFSAPRCLELCGCCLKIGNLFKLKDIKVTFYQLS
ncbi:unnamed protein product [Schistocephalus solidus]|uniref:Uncharacterized protein n=1 Tax=Schistocephalus solidus TaxID=70667 RepID=A0A183TBF9_SCHSO|nr:unnamed protein product [Schistocephalus solidus]